MVTLETAAPHAVEYWDPVRLGPGDTFQNNCFIKK
jgi:hypothetical protein